MVDVPDHLEPTDGLTRSSIRLAALSLRHGHVAQFDIKDEKGSLVGTLHIDVGDAGQNTAGVVADSYRQLTDMLRQWLYETDVMRQHYEAEANGPK